MKVTRTLVGWYKIADRNLTFSTVSIYLIGSRLNLGGSCVVPSDNRHITTREAFKRS